MGPRGLLVPALLGFCIPLLSMGCSSAASLNSVEGKVLHRKEPLKGVLVTFHPKSADIKSHPPTGLTKDDGTFALTTNGKAGAPAGDYVVTFVCSKEIQTKAKKFALQFEAPEARDFLEGAYADVTTSTFKVQIKPGANKLEPFQLK